MRTSRRIYSFSIIAHLVEFRYSAGEIARILSLEHGIYRYVYIYIDMTLSTIDMQH